MSVPRRRVIRPAPAVVSSAAARLPKLRTRLEQEQKSLNAWTTRLKRAFHSFEKHQQRITRLQKQIRSLKES